MSVQAKKHGKEANETATSTIIAASRCKVPRETRILVSELRKKCWKKVYDKTELTHVSPFEPVTFYQPPVDIPILDSRRYHSALHSPSFNKPQTLIPQHTMEQLGQPTEVIGLSSFMSRISVPNVTSRMPMRSSQTNPVEHHSLLLKLLMTGSIADGIEFSRMY